MKKTLFISVTIACIAIVFGYYWTAKNYELDNFPLEKSIPVEIAFSELTSVEFSEREQMDQVKDWLLLTVLTNIGLDTNQVNEVTFDIPVARYDYMKEIATLEYGDTRSKYIGDDAIIALVPKCDDQKRQDHFAHIADKHRKDLGEISEVIHPFEYEIGLDDNAAIVTRLETVEVEDLYENSAGYFEKEIGGLKDLQAVMQNVGDVTYVKLMNNGHLKIGGRQLLDREYKNITVEDIAALYQSEQEIQRKTNAFESKWYSKTYTTEAERRELERQMLADWRAQGIVDGSGFSLDPAYDFENIRKLLANYRNLFSEITPSYSTIIEQLEKRNIDDLFLAIGRIIDTDSYRGFEAELLLEEIRTFEYQKARYDGYLKGTEVGMNLFYTDLLAKLWAINYNYSTPESQILDFISYPELAVSKVFDAENEELNSVRLWFGTRDNGIQLSNDGSTLLFERNATKIYAASSNQLVPGQETPASAYWGASINWWNNHYEEVAEYEPEYEKLNENMKWSVIISWLGEEKLDALHFLENVKVERDNWFEDWAKSNEQLRFKEWDLIGFYPSDFLDNDTEVLPKLNSPRTISLSTISGGVSLGSKSQVETITRAPIKSSHTRRLHRAAYEHTLPGKITSKTGHSFRFTNNKVAINAAPDVKFRTKGGQLAEGEIQRVYTKKNSISEINVNRSDLEVNSFKIEAAENGFKVGLESRLLDKSNSIARQLSEAKDPYSVLRNSEAVENFVVAEGRITPTEVYFLPKNSKQWLKAEIDVPATMELETGSLMKIAGNQPTSKICELKLVQKNVIDNILEESGMRLHRPRSDLPSKRNWSDQANYQNNLKFVDELIANKEYGHAREGLQQLGKNFGNHPDLLFKKGLMTIQEANAMIDNGNIRQGVNKINQHARNLKTDKKARVDFYKNVEKMIAQQPFFAKNRDVVTQFVNYHLKAEVSVLHKVNVNRLIGKGKRVSKKELIQSHKNKDAKIYIQDNPSFNNLDKSVKVEKSISTILEKYPEAIVEKIPVKVSDVKVELGVSSKYSFGSEGLNLRLSQSSRIGRGTINSGSSSQDSLQLLPKERQITSAPSEFIYIVYLQPQDIADLNSAESSQEIEDFIQMMEKLLRDYPSIDN